MFYIYILKCKDNSLYVGFANDIEKRIAVHRSGKGSKYVRAHLPIELVYKEEFDDKSTALKREIEIKKWSRERKIKDLRIMF